MLHPDQGPNNNLNGSTQSDDSLDQLNPPMGGRAPSKVPKATPDEPLNPEGAWRITISSPVHLLRVVQILKEQPARSVNVNFSGIHSAKLRKLVLNLPANLDQILAVVKREILDSTELCADDVHTLALSYGLDRLPTRTVAKSYTIDMSRFASAGSTEAPLIKDGKITARGHELLRLMDEFSTVPGNNKPFINFAVPEKGLTRDVVRQQLKHFLVTNYSSLENAEPAMSITRIVEAKDFIPRMLSFTRHISVPKFLDERSSGEAGNAHPPLDTGLVSSDEDPIVLTPGDSIGDNIPAGNAGEDVSSHNLSGESSPQGALGAQPQASSGDRREPQAKAESELREEPDRDDLSTPVVEGPRGEKGKRLSREPGAGIEAKEFELTRKGAAVYLRQLLSTPLYNDLMNAGERDLAAVKVGFGSLIDKTVSLAIRSGPSERPLRRRLSAAAEAVLDVVKEAQPTPFGAGVISQAAMDKVEHTLQAVLNHINLKNKFADSEGATAVWRAVEALRAATFIVRREELKNLAMSGAISHKATTPAETFMPWVCFPIGLRVCEAYPIQSTTPGVRFRFATALLDNKGNRVKVCVFNENGDSTFVRDEANSIWGDARIIDKRELPAPGQKFLAYLRFKPTIDRKTLPGTLSRFPHTGFCLVAEFYDREKDSEEQISETRVRPTRKRKSISV